MYGFRSIDPFAAELVLGPFWLKRALQTGQTCKG